MLALPTLSGVTTTVYVGAGNNLWKRKSTAAATLQKSTDAGDSWSDIYTFANAIGAVIEFDDGTLLVSIDPTDSFTDPVAVWWRSTDGGSTFTDVLTFTNGGVQLWSHDYYGDTVFLAEYGKYPAPYVHRSTDKGATWSTVFTHPRQAQDPTNCHMHTVHIDRENTSRIWLSAGDGVPSKGMWYSTDGGDNWTDWNQVHQPTHFDTLNGDLFIFQDLEAAIHRVPVADVLSGTYTLERVYYAPDDNAGDYGNVSFYCGKIASNGLIFGASVAYGADSNPVSGNTKDSVLVVSTDGGDTWRVVRSYPGLATGASGSAYISKETTSGLLYVTVEGDTKTVEVLDTNDPDLLTLAQTYYPHRNVTRIVGHITTN